MKTFDQFFHMREGTENFDQPHTITADPPMKLPQGVTRIIEAFKKSKEVPIAKEIDPKAGGEKDVTLKSKRLYVAGEAVAAYLMGKTPSSYELVTDAHPEEIVKILSHARPAIRILKRDPKAGTIQCQVDGETYDISTLKKDGGDGGDPVFSTNILDDAQRRDLTIHALYYDLMGNKITDHVGGIRHLKDGLVKSVGKASDLLGKNGMAKFKAAKMANVVPNGKLDPEMKDAINGHELEDADPEAIRKEFIDGIEHRDSDVVKFVKTYEELGLLPVVFPKLELDTDFPEGAKLGKSRAGVLAWLLKPNKPQKLVEKLRQLKYTDREVKDAVFLINLLVFSPEYAYEFYNEKAQIGLTRRQVMDWVKLNGLDREPIEKLLDWRFRPATSAGANPDAHRRAVRHQAVSEFRKLLAQ